MSETRLISEIFVFKYGIDIAATTATDETALSMMPAYRILKPPYKQDGKQMRDYNTDYSKQHLPVVKIPPISRGSELNGDHSVPISILTDFATVQADSGRYGQGVSETKPDYRGYRGFIEEERTISDYFPRRSYCKSRRSFKNIPNKAPPIRPPKAPQAAYTARQNRSTKARNAPL